MSLSLSILLFAFYSFGSTTNLISFERYLQFSNHPIHPWSLVTIQVKFLESSRGWPSSNKTVNLLLPNLKNNITSVLKWMDHWSAQDHFTKPTSLGKIENTAIYASVLHLPHNPIVNQRIADDQINSSHTSIPSTVAQQMSNKHNYPESIHPLNDPTGTQPDKITSAV